MVVPIVLGLTNWHHIKEERAGVCACSAWELCPRNLTQSNMEFCKSQTPIIWLIHDSKRWNHNIVSILNNWEWNYNLLISRKNINQIDHKVKVGKNRWLKSLQCQFIHAKDVLICDILMWKMQSFLNVLKRFNNDRDSIIKPTCHHLWKDSHFIGKKAISRSRCQ